MRLFPRGRVFSRLTATSQGVIERPFCRLSSQPVIFQLTLVTPFKKAHSLGTLCRVAPARKKTFQGTELSRMWYYLQHLSCLEREFQGYQIGYDCENHAWDKWKILLSRHIFWNVTLRGLLEMDQKMNYLIHVFMFVVHFFCCFFVCLFDSGSFSEMNEFNYCLNNFLFASDRGPCGGEGIRKPLRHSSLHALTQPV